MPIWIYIFTPYSFFLPAHPLLFSSPPTCWGTVNPLYIRDLSLCGFCLPRGVLEPVPCGYQMMTVIVTQPVYSMNCRGVTCCLKYLCSPVTSTKLVDTPYMISKHFNELWQRKYQNFYLLCFFLVSVSNGKL